MAKRQAAKVIEEGITISGVQFYVDKQTLRGRVKFDYDQTSRGNRMRKEVQLPIIAIWQDPVTDDAVKCHMIANFRDIQQRDFYKSCTGIGYLRGQRTSMSIIAGKTVSFSMDQKQPATGGLIRYGLNLKENPVFHANDMSDGYEDYYIFDSKALAMKAIMQSVQDQGVALGGLQDVNFNLFPDSMLRSIGFQEVPDLLRRSVSMWKGNPAKVFSTGGYESSETKKRNLKEFLLMIEKFLSGGK